jgi:hypothetical protein
MIEHIYEREFKSRPEKIKEIWHKLQLRETFVSGQIPPYKVEFESGEKSGPFYTGEKNIHHGPLLSLPGEIGNISESYRDLQYYYGAYLISFRLFRPKRLEFFKTKELN